MSETLTFDILKQAVAGHAAAFRCVTEYQPAGGVGDTVFPSTYEDGRYAVEKRILDGGEIVDCVRYALRPLERAGNYSLAPIGSHEHAVPIR